MAVVNERRRHSTSAGGLLVVAYGRPVGDLVVEFADLLLEAFALFAGGRGEGVDEVGGADLAPVHGAAVAVAGADRAPGGRPRGAGGGWRR